MEAINNVIVAIDNVLWGVPMVVILFGTHLYLTFRTRFIQRYIFKAIKLSITKDEGAPGDVSPFAALTTALAATIGTGNIVGVATAITLGGPGAVLWMWLTGVFGIATKYTEALLAVKYRVRTEDGTMLGGPMYAIERGMKMKWLGVVFAAFTAIASFGIGNMTQANSIAGLMEGNLNMAPWITGVILSIITGIVVIGGIKRIASVTEKLVPFMAIFYIVGCLIILVMNAAYIGPALALIFKSAFSAQAAGGGFVASTIMLAARYGIARGLFSNESGLGSAPIVAAAAQTSNPVRQALIASTGTFWDTVVVCAMTGLVLVTTMLKFPGIGEGLNGSKLTNAAFDQIPVVGPIILTVGLFTFVFSTILGWEYYGERAIEYLFGKKGMLPYRILYTLVVFIGATTALEIVWNFADAANAAMAIPNVISMFALMGIVLNETKKYLWDGPDNINLVDSEPVSIYEIKKH